MTGINPRGGGTRTFSYIRRLGSFLGVQNFEFQYFSGFSEKLIFLGGMKILWIFLGSSQNWTILRGRPFLFLGVLEMILIFFFWGGGCWARAYV